MVLSQKQPDWQQRLASEARRNLSVELAPVGEPDGWRVRMLEVDEDADSLLVEHPALTRSGVALRAGQDLELRLVGAAPQWSLTCRVLERLKHRLNSGETVAAVRLSWPFEARQFQRRTFFRVSAITEDVTLRVWPLCEAKLAIAAERALQHAWRARLMRDPANALLPRPDVGRELAARAVDFSAGGLGVTLSYEDHQALDAYPYLWIELAFEGEPLPICCVGRPAHVRKLSQMVRLGIAFQFDHHPAHEPFVTDWLCQQAVTIQRHQLRLGRSRRRATG